MITLETGIGDHYDSVAAMAKRKSIDANDLVEFDFNGIKCIVGQQTNLAALYEYYSTAHLMGWKEVGPDCLPFSGELLTEINNKKSQRMQERDAERAEYEAKQKAAEDALMLKLQNAPQLDVNRQDWMVATDGLEKSPYIAVIEQYAGAWGKLMQMEIEAGKTVEEAYRTTQKDVDHMGITGNQFGGAVLLLVRTWKYGEELRVAHNKSFGITDSDGLVNPAVLKKL